MMIRRTILAVAMAMGCVASAAHAQAPVADYFSSSSSKDGQSLAPGTVIEAYDGDGIRCGYAEADANGDFLIHVYGNDPITPGIDEGASEDEMLTWKIDGFDIPASGVTWIANLIGMFADARWENGAAKEIQLDVRTTSTQSTSWSDVKSHYRQ